MVLTLVLVYLGLCLLKTYVSKAFGRRRTTALAAVLMALSAVLMAAAPNFATFCVGRVFGGLAGGILMTNIPVYSSEIAPAHSRGLVAGICASTNNLGYIVVGAFGLAFTFVEGDMQWRSLFIVLAGFTGILLASLLTIPESPRWLADKGRYDEAWDVLRVIHHHPLDPELRIARAEMAQIRAQIDAEREMLKGWVHIFTTRALQKRVFLTVWLWLLANSSGIFVIANLAPRLFGQLGYSVTLQLGLVLAWLSIGYCRIYEQRVPHRYCWAAPVNFNWRHYHLNSAFS